MTPNIIQNVDISYFPKSRAVPTGGGGGGGGGVGAGRSVKVTITLL